MGVTSYFSRMLNYVNYRVSVGWRTQIPAGIGRSSAAVLVQFSDKLFISVGGSKIQKMFHFRLIIWDWLLVWNVCNPVCI